MSLTGRYEQLVRIPCTIQTICVEVRFMGWSPFRKTGLTYKDSRSFGGYTLITPIGGDAVYLLGENGLVVHHWKVPDFQPGYGYLLPGGNLLVRGTPLIENGVGVGQPAGETDIFGIGLAI